MRSLTNPVPDGVAVCWKPREHPLQVGWDLVNAVQVDTFTSLSNLLGVATKTL